MHEAFSLAIERYEAGRLEEAEEICRKIVDVRPNHSAATNLLGLVLLNNKQYDHARALFDRAIRIDPLVPDYHNNLGSLYQEQQRLDLAESCYRQALTLKPDHPDILANLGDVLRQQERYDDAAVVLGYVLNINPCHAPALTNLGDLYQALHRLDEAVENYRRAMVCAPHNIKVLTNLGTTLEQQGKLCEAALCFYQALGLNPRLAAVLSNLGNILLKQGEIENAIHCFGQALAIQPDFAPAHNNLGLALAEFRRFEEAAISLRQALAISPNYVEAVGNLGDVFAEQGRADEAAECYSRGLKMKGLPSLKIKLATLLPAIVEAEENIGRIRTTFHTALINLKHDRSIKLLDPVIEVGQAFFYLTYHGLNNRNLKTELTQLFEQACPDLLWEAPHCRLPRRPTQHIKVGFISKYLYDHSIGKTTQGLIAKLPRDRFRIFAIFAPPVREDRVSRFIREKADEVVELHASLDTARQQIAKLELDVLFYQDIGMDPFTYFLAFSRLAPIQCTSFGHPDTTGIRNMDYFVTSALFETKSGDEHYSEKLYRLQNVGLPAYYYRPTTPGAKMNRSDFGLPSDKHLYLCPQTLFKLHPSFDVLLGDILRGDPSGLLILLKGGIPHFATLIRQRFQKTMPDVVDRVMFLPPQHAIDFMSLLEMVDVMLDTPYFNGMNTTLEAFAVGTPVVTFPGELQRARHGFGMYLKMEISDCIAQSGTDYVRIALQLVNDPQFRDEVRGKILARNHVLYEDETVVREFAQFFEYVVGAQLE